MVETGEDSVGSVGLELSVNVLEVVIICKGETAQSVVVVVVRVEGRDVVPAFLKILFGNNQKVVDVLGDGEVDGVDSDALDFGGGEVDVELLEVCVVDVEDHFGESRVLFCA